MENNKVETITMILCEYVGELELNNRAYQEIKCLLNDIMTKVINVVYSQIEKVYKLKWLIYFFYHFSSISCYFLYW